MKALILSGGGSHAAVTVGALYNHLKNNPTNYDIVAGVSAGAINASYLVSSDAESFFDKTKSLIKLWKNIENETYIYRKRPLGVASAMFSGSLYDTSPLEKFLSSNISVENVINSDIKLYLGATNLVDGTYEEKCKFKKDMLIKWIMASSSFPGYFPPVIINEGFYTDGGIKHVLPTDCLWDNDCTEADVFLTHPITKNKPSELWKPSYNLAKILGRILEVGYSEVTFKDLQPLRRISKYKKTKFNIFVPQKHFDGHVLSFDQKQVKKMIQYGKTIKPQRLEDL